MDVFLAHLQEALMQILPDYEASVASTSPSDGYSSSAKADLDVSGTNLRLYLPCPSTAVSLAVRSSTSIYDSPIAQLLSLQRQTRWRNGKSQRHHADIDSASSQPNPRGASACALIHPARGDANHPSNQCDGVFSGRGQHTGYAARIGRTDPRASLACKGGSRPAGV
ncbi:hypothetical protein FKP32DRAFT_1188664 [Trametes sanguinea]|nr:hypothetical protein FKP32DRAFT_1188664 [Trametes sanguinea]